MKNVAGLVDDGEQKIVVLSAMSGTTNSLVDIANYYSNANAEGATDVIGTLETKYAKHVSELYGTKEYADKAREVLNGVFTFLRSFAGKHFGPVEEKEVLAQGEIMSTYMFTFYMQEQGRDVLLLPALNFMKLDPSGEPDLPYIAEHLGDMLEQKQAYLYVTQGFICRNSAGDVDNLQRGGSDYTASLVGAAIGAEEIQIWTDIDGMHNNDPRVVDHTKAVHHIHFEEASELAYFGAKVLHPTCIQPAKNANIPVRILNTMQPEAEGTLINNELEEGLIKAVAAKDNIAAIRIKSSRMLMTYGFLRRVFEIFEKYKTSIDMICTSEVGVSLSVDNTSHLNEIVHELKKYGTVSVDLDMCIVCVVGDMNWENVGFESRAMEAMKSVPVRMVSYGGSNYNISFLVRGEDKNRALRALSASLFNNQE
jgi:aspartate kinase